MTTSGYIIFFVILYLCIILPRQNAMRRMRVKLAKRRRNKEENPMHTLIMNYIGKECVLTIPNQGSVAGVIKQIKENWVEIETAEGLEVVNLDYISRVREYPKNKNGKKKLIIG